MFANHGYEEGVKRILANQIQQILEREGLCEKKVQSAKRNRVFSEKLGFCLFRNREETWRQFFLPVLGAGLCFLSCTLLTVFALLPLFWNPTFLIFGVCLLGVTLFAYRELQKEAHGRLTLYLASVVVVGVVSGYMVRTVWRVFDGVAWAITTPHNVEHFFLGQVLYDPGWLFYPLVLCIKTTPLTLPLVFGGCLFLWRKHHPWSRIGHEGYARQFRIALALVAVVLLFTLCLSLTSKKFSRYLLPAFPILEILAAIGFFEFLKWGYSYIDSRFGTETNSPKTYLFYRDRPLSLPDPNPAGPTASPLLRHLLQPLLQTH